MCYKSRWSEQYCHRKHFLPGVSVYCNRYEIYITFINNVQFAFQIMYRDMLCMERNSNLEGCYNECCA
jgi:hypothetical protein